MDIIQASVPLFFLLIGLELVVARLRGQRLYRLNDSISDLSLGILSQLTGIFVALLTIALYGWVASRFALTEAIGVRWIDDSPFPTRSGGLGIGLDLVALASWLTVFVLDDFVYYWVHRFSHEVNVLWAGHVVHHSSEEYNLTVALRQSSLHGLFTWIFYLPLAALGVPVTMWVICHGLNLIYQFWIHTRGVGRLPRWAEAFLNTPSHHRVHHGVNPQYQDRNYAGVFIVWDRWFGTFEPEVEEPVYGITKPLASFNPLWANFHVFAEIGRTVRDSRRWGDRLRAVFGHPGWRPAHLGPSVVPRPVSATTFEKYDPPTPRPLLVYAAVQFLTVLVASVALLDHAASLPLGQTLAGVFYLALSLGNLGGVIERRAWAAVSELVRLAVLAVAAAVLLWLGRAGGWLLWPALGLALGSCVWITWLRPHFSAPLTRPAAMA
ncbi:MAG: sterol desaturase family protein [Gemmatimonadales bacterium]